LPLWLTEDVVQPWHATTPENKRGHPRTYTDPAITAMATPQEIDHLGVRQTAGLRESSGEWLHLEEALPESSTLSRRRATVEVVLPRTRSGLVEDFLRDLKDIREGKW